MANLSEVSLRTSDLDRSRRFFEAVLALPPARVGETSVSYETGDCELKIQGDFPPDVLASFNLGEPPADGRGAGTMVVLELDEPLVDVHRRVDEFDEALGVDALIEPREVPWGVRMFLARSPEGYLFEIRGADE